MAKQLYTDVNTKKLNTIGGWLTVFILFHIFILGGWTINIITDITSGMGVMQGALYLIPVVMFLASLVMLIIRKPIFRYAYAAYCLMMISTYLSYSAHVELFISFTVVVTSLLITLPWLLYVFRSERVRGVLGEDKE